MAVATKRVRIPRPEKGVIRGCLDLLLVEHIWHMRTNSGAMQVDNRFIQFNVPGCADIMATPILRTYDNIGYGKDKPAPIFAVVLWVECKSDIGTQTDDQKAFQAEAERHGHRYIVVNDVDQLREELKKYGRVK